MTSTAPPNEIAQKQPVPLSQMPGVLFGRPWLWSTLVVIVGMLFLGRLGFWQLDRLDQRRATNALLEQQFNSERLDLNEGLPAGNPADLVDRRAVVNGRFDYAEQIVLKEQNFSGRPGVHLITPLIIEGQSEAILVDRGWIPATEAAEGGLEAFDETAVQPLEGVLKGSQTLSRGRQTIIEANQTEWYRIDIEAIQTLSSYDLAPVYLIQSPSEENGTTLPIREESELDLSEGSHLGYAIQWFLFALILGIVYGGYVRVHH
jgi:surfeit locus 1 family protein